MRKETVLILGAQSDIAIAIAHRFAKEKSDIQLAARNVERLIANKSDIELRYQVAVSLYEFDALDTKSHESFVCALSQLPTVAICAVGHMGEQDENIRDLQKAVHVMRSNYEGPVNIMAVLANHFEQRGSGVLVGISSVAGERGRAKNYVYGSAKAGFTTFLSGLRNRLANKGVHVVTVHPGFVATKMTEGMDLPKRLTTQPNNVANSVFSATQNKTNFIYVHPIWRFIMMIIKNIPEQIFKKMNI
jgi:decaprenylphospho-beta-D-erythro-pentofuranosid-2-ulose 2-reductase